MSTVVKLYVEGGTTQLRFPFNKERNKNLKCFLRKMKERWGNPWAARYNDQGAFVCWEIFHLQDDHKGQKVFYLPEYLSTNRDIFHLKEEIIGHDAIISLQRVIGKRLYHSDSQEISCQFEHESPPFNQCIANSCVSPSQPSTPPRLIGGAVLPGTPPTEPRIAKRLKVEENAAQVCAADGSPFSSKQQFFLDSAEMGKNVFLTGAAGTGKTFVIHEVVRRLRQQGKRVAVTSSTGNTAVAIEGQTLFSLVGCGLCESNHDLKKMWECGRRDEWRSIDVLIVDEVGMIQVQLYKTERCMRCRPFMLSFSTTILFVAHAFRGTGCVPRLGRHAGVI